MAHSDWSIVMLTFRNKEEEEFWKQILLTTISNARGSTYSADKAVEELRLRQPIQQFPGVPKE